jgi:hypothetical protein
MPVNKTRKKIKVRKAPAVSAREYSEGTIEWGNNNQKWVVVKTEKGVHRWVPYSSASIFGYAPLTADILRKNINKPVTVYERSSQMSWPKNARSFDVKYVFTASGDAELLKKEKKDCKNYTNWLKNKNSTVKVKKNDVFIIKGAMASNDLGEDVSIQVAPLPNGELISTNLMNTDAFVKIE